MKIDLVQVSAATHAHLESADWALNMEVKCIFKNFLVTRTWPTLSLFPGL